MNLGDYGGLVYIGVEEDISGASSLTFQFTSPTGNISKKTATLGTEDANGLLANQYGKYQVENGLINESGSWKVKLLATFPDNRRSTDNLSFYVSK